MAFALQETFDKRSQKEKKKRGKKKEALGFKKIWLMKIRKWESKKLWLQSIIMSEAFLFPLHLPLGSVTEPDKSIS